MADRKAPIFIVGAPRSGTTLLATMLSSHSRISCGAETHFFPHWEANFRKVASLLRDPIWPDSATEFVLSLSVEDHQISELFEVDVQTIYDYLANQKPSIRALLESLTISKMIADGKSRWAEKTPNHILHVNAIRRIFPLPISGRNNIRNLKWFIGFLIDLLPLRFKGVDIKYSTFCQRLFNEQNFFGKAATRILMLLGSNTELPV